MTDFDWHRFAADGWPHLLAAFDAVIAVLASIHVVLYKRPSPSRPGWFAVIWLVPLVGVLLYLLFGINRIRRRAVALHRRVSVPQASASVVPVSGGELPPSLRNIHRVINQVTRRPLLAGNEVEPLLEAGEALAAMLESIARARHSITLCTYIFDNDEAGRRFVAALAEAAARGVEVRVLVDAVGLRYSWFNPVDRELVAQGVRVARFLPPRFIPWHLPYANLRNHRKILVVDGTEGYTGGMNIRAPQSGGRAVLRDLHFRLRGPVVGQLQRSFQEDWLFASRELLVGERWFPPLESAGQTLARGVSDGPDEDFDRLFWSYLAGIQAAQQSIHVLTPYFLPEPELVSALNGAAMRGVAVNIVLPEQSNLVLVDWATSGVLESLIAHGCRFWLTPPPFDHGKLFLVDDAWSLVGSGNWDPRSLKLNFEFVVECYDPALGRRLRYVFEERMARARELTLAELRGRPFWIRLRDGLAGMLAPYL